MKPSLDHFLLRTSKFAMLGLQKSQRLFSGIGGRILEILTVNFLLYLIDNSMKSLAFTRLSPSALIG